MILIENARTRMDPSVTRVRGEEAICLILWTILERCAGFVTLQVPSLLSASQRKKEPPQIASTPIRGVTTVSSLTKSHVLSQTFKISPYITVSARRKIPATWIIFLRLPRLISTMRNVISAHMAQGLNPSISPSTAESEKSVKSLICISPTSGSLRISLLATSDTPDPFSASMISLPVVFASPNHIMIFSPICVIGVTCARLCCLVNAMNFSLPPGSVTSTVVRSKGVVLASSVRNACSAIQWGQPSREYTVIEGFCA